MNFQKAFAVNCLLSLSAVGIASEPERSVTLVPLPAARLEIVAHDYGPSRWLLCNVHDDENTSVQAAKVFLAKAKVGGRLVEFRHTGERNVMFQLGDRRFEFDPNRIYTSAGVAKTLAGRAEEDEALTAEDPEAQKIVEDVGQRFIKAVQLKSAQVVIALHNNTEDRYAAWNYLKGQEYEIEAADVHLNAERDTDDFFFVTDRRLFDALAAREFNVVLQNNEAATDDGSLIGLLWPAWQAVRECRSATWASRGPSRNANGAFRGARGSVPSQMMACIAARSPRAMQKGMISGLRWQPPKWKDLVARHVQV